MADITLTSNSYTVDLTHPSGMLNYTSKIVTTFLFQDQSDAILDTGKSNHQITLMGKEYDEVQVNVHTKMNVVNQMMDSREVVALTGMDDSWVNQNYFIAELDFSRVAGEPNIYKWSITLERIRDVL